MKQLGRSHFRNDSERSNGPKGTQWHCAEKLVIFWWTAG